MLRRLRPRSAYDVMAAIAFFIAIAGGTAWAADTIGSSDIIDGSILTDDVRGNAATPTQGKINGTLTTYDIRDRTLTHGDYALGSVTKAELGPAQAWQNVKDPVACPASGGEFSCINLGSPANYWGNDSAATNNDAAYYKDPYGVVHLKGIVCKVNTGCPNTGYSGLETMMVLPAGYLPAKDWYFHTESTSGEASIVVRSADGKVDLLRGNYAGVAL